MIQPVRAWPELHAAQRAVLVEMLQNGSRPRVELARTLGLSRGSLTRLTRELIDLGFIAEGEGRQRSTRGRPAEVMDVVHGSAHFVGIKLTGDALYAVVTDLGSRVVAEARVELPSRDVATVVELIARTCEELVVDYERPGAIGICLAGDVETIDGRPHITGSAFLGWDDPVPLARLVTEQTGLPVVVSNDVQALTAGHHSFGPGAGRRSLVVIAVGAGIGAGVVVADQLLVGAHARQGRIGHVGVAARGERRCALGHHGCAGALVTMRGVALNAGRPEHGYAEALAAARGGERAAVDAFHDAAVSLGAIAAQFVNVLDPEVVVVTGEGIDMVDLAPGRAEESFHEHLDPRSSREVSLLVHPFDFAHYAWGAAITAIRDRVWAV